MKSLARTAALAAAFTLAAASHVEAQSSTVRVTLAGGPHAGTYEIPGQCDLTPGQFPSMFIMAFKVGAVPPNLPRSIEFFSVDGKGKPDGFVVNVLFYPAGKRVAYEIYAIPPEQQQPPRLHRLRGRGSVTVRQTATGRTATFRGQTAEGVRMEGSVDCRKG